MQGPPGKIGNACWENGFAGISSVGVHPAPCVIIWWSCHELPFCWSPSHPYWSHVGPLRIGLPLNSVPFLRCYPHVQLLVDVWVCVISMPSDVSTGAPWNNDQPQFGEPPGQVVQSGGGKKYMQHTPLCMSIHSHTFQVLNSVYIHFTYIHTHLSHTFTHFTHT